jgi:hypothetical protein
MNVKIILTETMAEDTRDKKLQVKIIFICFGT